MVQQQNPIVKKLCISIVKAFEKKTGCKVNMTMEGYGSIIGPKYRTNFVAGKKPTVMDATPRWTGQIRNFLRPLDDLIEKEWDQKAREGISWFLPLNQKQNSGYADKDSIKDLPFIFIAQAPVVTRKDHWKKAGIDFDSNWPIRDTDHFLELCNAFKTAGVTEYPTEVYGKIWDAGDTQLNGWIRSIDKETSHFINDDWSKSYGDSEAWIKGLQFYVDVFRKYQYSSPDSPQSSDEASVEQLIRGIKTLVHCDILNRGTFLARMPNEMKDGTIQWGPHFPITGGTSGSVAFLSCMSQSIVKQEGPDAKIKEQAAWEFIKEWFVEENQIALAKSSGPCSRRDLWDKLKGEPDNYAESQFAMMNDPGVWTNHPKGVDIQYNLFAPHCQKAMGGADVATELKAYAEEVNKILKL
jgi:ABC-type glycerol-3-phosphate transport system substrate-binding protein